MMSSTHAPQETVHGQSHDRAWMIRALDLARRALGRVAPNPAVGAVIVRDGEVVGEGFTEQPGRRHAEIVALESAADSARDATMYVTLEPCTHVGRTPPCVNGIISAGIARVVVAVRDVNPLVDGRGIRTLREHGVDVELGLCANEAARLNNGFIRRMVTGVPEVHVKYAMSLDGRIATRTGASRWITGPEARQAAHLIRDRSDAILVGIGTVLADDPRLTTRIPDELSGAGGPHDPLRVVLDSAGRLPLDSAILQNGSQPPLVVLGPNAQRDALARLEAAGANVVTVETLDGRLDIQSVLNELGDRGVNSLMVEGGASVIGSLFDADLVDRVTAFIAPVVLGGQTALSPITGLGVEHPDEGMRLIQVELEEHGRDFSMSGWIAGHEPDIVGLTCSPAS